MTPNLGLEGTEGFLLTLNHVRPARPGKILEARIYTASCGVMATASLVKPCMPEVQRGMS